MYCINENVFGIPVVSNCFLLLCAVSSKGSSPGFTAVRDLLRREFNRSVELQVHPPSLVPP